MLWVRGKKENFERNTHPAEFEPVVAAHDQNEFQDILCERFFFQWSLTQ